MSAKPNIGFVFEQSLGHVTHSRNLKAVLASDNTIRSRWLPVPFEVEGWAAKVPVFNSNWTVRAGLRARRAIGFAHRRDPLDALFIHTQVPAVLMSDWLKRIPSVISIDATPLQFDAFGTHYAHRRNAEAIERIKWRANRLAFKRAAAVVAWSAWAKASLVDDYGVPEEKVTVIPPGVWFDRWSRPEGEPSDEGVIRILFVGADLERKGGPTLLSAFRQLRAQLPGDDGASGVDFHLVTKQPVSAEPGVFVHGNMAPNDPALLDLYRHCHIFCLPTRADMFGLVLCEAGAAGLPRVSTDVGGISDVVTDGETGLLVPPDDVDALCDALVKLVEEPDLRRRLGDQAAEIAESRFDARKNARQLLGLLRSVAATRE